MVDAGGFSPTILRAMMKRQYKRDSVSSVAEDARHGIPSKKTKAFSLLTGLFQFLSAVVLVLLAISTLPYAPFYHVFIPASLLSVLAAVSGAYSLTISWLGLSALRAPRCVWIAFILCVISLFLLFFAGGGAWGVGYFYLSHEDKQYLFSHAFYTFVIFTPTAILIYFASTAFNMIFLGRKILFESTGLITEATNADVQNI